MEPTLKPWQVSAPTTFPHTIFHAFLSYLESIRHWVFISSYIFYKVEDKTLEMLKSRGANLNIFESGNYDVASVLGAGIEGGKSELVFTLA